MFYVCFTLACFWQNELQNNMTGILKRKNEIGGSIKEALFILFVHNVFLELVAGVLSVNLLDILHSSN